MGLSFGISQGTPWAAKGKVHFDGKYLDEREGFLNGNYRSEGKTFRAVEITNVQADGYWANKLAFQTRARAQQAQGFRRF